MKRPASVFQASTPFVGRITEFEWLETRLRVGISGQPQLVLISGEAGIGKTRLTRQLEEEASRGGVRVVRGRAREDLAIPYLLFDPLLEALAATDRGMDGLASAQGAVRHLLDHRKASPDRMPGGVEADAERLRVFKTIAETLFAHARTGAVLVVLEDLHWADAASLDLLAHLTYAAADASGPVPLVLVCTLRPSEGSAHLARILDRVRREQLCNSLQLAGLDEAELDLLVRAMVQAEPSRQLVARLAATTAGNPLFIEEIVRLLEREGELVERGGRSVTNVDPAELPLPKGISETIVSRTSGLTAACRDALTVAACFGDRCEVEDLAAVSGCGKEILLDRLDEAMRAGVIVSHLAELRFGHPLVRQAFYTSASPARRQQIHRRIAEFLERRYGDDLQAHAGPIAHHWIRGQTRADAAKAVHYARLAGEQAFAVFASGEAALSYEAALSVDARAGGLSQADLADLHYRAALAHYRNMDGSACLQHLERAIEIYRNIDDVAGQARALMEQARTYFTLAPVSYGTLIDVSGLEQSLERLGDTEPALRGWIYFTLTDAFMHARQTRRAEECGRRARELGRELADDRLLAAANISLGSAQSQRLAVRETLESYRESRRHAARADDPWVEGWSLQRLPLALVWLGRMDEAEAVQGEASRSARRTGDWADHSLALGAKATIAAVRGDFAAVEAHARETMTMVRRSRYPWGGFLALTALYAARALRGEWAAAEDALAILEEPGRVFDERGPLTQSVAAVGRLRLRALSGRATEDTRTQTENLSRALLSVGPEVGTIGAFCAFVEIADQLEDPSLAEPCVSALEFAKDQGIVFAGGGEFLLPRVLAVAATLGGRWDRAASHFEAAIEAARRAGARPEVARSQLDFASMQLLLDDPARAGELLEQAMPLFQELGMDPFLARARRMADKLSVSVEPARHPPASQLSELSRREVEVLAALARGRSDPEICEMLLLRSETLSQYKRTLFEKIGVDGRTGATAYAFAQGLEVPAALRDRVGGAGAGHASTTGEVPTPYLATQRPEGGPQVIMVSDIEQSTAFIQRLGDMKAQEVIRLHNRIVRTCVRTHAGSEIQHTGDGFILSFASAADGVRCAIAIQQMLARRIRWQSEWPLRVRIGLHAGEPLPEEGRLFGVAMNATARICSHAAAQEVLVSDLIRSLCEGSELSFSPVGPVPLKGLQEPIQLYRVLWEDERGADGTGAV